MNIRKLLLCWALAIALSGFSVKAGASGPEAKPQEILQLPSATRIVLAPLLIEYRDVKNNAIMEVPQDDQGRLCKALSAALLNELKQKGLDVVGTEALNWVCEPRSNLPDLYRTSKMAKSDRKKDEMETLSAFLKELGEEKVLFVKSRFYIGPGGYWLPVNGLIASGSSRMVLEGHLLSPDSEAPEWNRVVQLHIRPKDDDSFKEIVKNLLKPVNQK